MILFVDAGHILTKERGHFFGLADTHKPCGDSVEPMHKMALVVQVFVKQLVDTCLFNSSSLLAWDPFRLVEHNQVLILKHNHIIQ